MHGSVLTNKKYIKFANENTVEVISMGKLNLGQERNDKRLETYEAKDENGETVQYLAGWPNLTLDELKKLNQTCAKWNDTRGIPYTCVVNPHTLEKMEFISGGYAAGKLMEQVTASKKALNKLYGKSVSRKTLAKIRKEERKVRVELDKENVAKAMTGWRTLDKKVAKQPDAIKAIAAKLLDDILKVGGKQLDECEALIGRGEKKAAAKTLGTLSRALKGTALEQRANDLLAKAKAEA